MINWIFDNSVSKNVRQKMGIMQSKAKRRESYPNVSLKDFKFEKDFMSNIGKGGFGRVLAMTHLDTNRHFAIKSLTKAKIIAKGQVQNSLNEFIILKSLEHSPFIVNLWYAFQNKHTLYMCLDLMLGGSLQYALNRDKGFDLERARFYMAELILGLQFLHSHYVVHRDIKPDNLLLNAEGHLSITDFNVSLLLSPDDSTTEHASGWGTRGYRAPEVYLGKGAGYMYACDWWSAGATLYKMLTNRLPYVRENGQTASSLVKRIALNDFDYSYGEDGILPNKESSDIILGLLAFKPENRLGCANGPNSEVIIMTNPFFEGMDWDALEQRNGSVPVPWVPERAEGNQREKQGFGFSRKPKSERKIKLSSKDSSKNISSYAGNFDMTLDHQERIRVLQRNMGVLGFDGFDDYCGSSDEDDYRSLSPAEQALFSAWKYNVEASLEMKMRPEYAVMQMVSSMEPAELKEWVINSPEEKLKIVCSQMKRFHEDELKGSYELIQTEFKVDELVNKNLKLSTQVRNLTLQNDMYRSLLRAHNIQLPANLEFPTTSGATPPNDASAATTVKPGKADEASSGHPRPQATDFKQQEPSFDVRSPKRDTNAVAQPSPAENNPVAPNSPKDVTEEEEVEEEEEVVLFDKADPPAPGDKPVAAQ